MEAHITSSFWNVVLGVTAAGLAVLCQPSAYHMLASCYSRSCSPWILYHDWHSRTTV